MNKAKIAIHVSRALQVISVVIGSLVMIILSTYANTNDDSTVKKTVALCFLTLALAVGVYYISKFVISIAQNYIDRQEAAMERDAQRRSCRAFYDCKATKNSGFYTKSS